MKTYISHNDTFILCGQYHGTYMYMYRQYNEKPTKKKIRSFSLVDMSTNTKFKNWRGSAGKNIHPKHHIRFKATHHLQNCEN